MEYEVYAPLSPPLPSSPLRRGKTLEDTIGDRDVEKVMLKSSAADFKAKTEASTLLGREVGNMYCASVYGGLASLLTR